MHDEEVSFSYYKLLVHSDSSCIPRSVLEISKFIFKKLFVFRLLSWLLRGREMKTTRRFPRYHHHFHRHHGSVINHCEERQTVSVNYFIKDNYLPPRYLRSLMMMKLLIERINLPTKLSPDDISNNFRKP